MKAKNVKENVVIQIHAVARLANDWSRKAREVESNGEVSVADTYRRCSFALTDVVNDVVNPVFGEAIGVKPGEAAEISSEVGAYIFHTRQRAIRAHQICNLLRQAHPDIGELDDDGCLHEAIHDILRVDVPQALCLIGSEAVGPTESPRPSAGGVNAAKRAPQMQELLDGLCEATAHLWGDEPKRALVDFFVNQMRALESAHG